LQAMQANERRKLHSYPNKGKFWLEESSCFGNKMTQGKILMEK